ncbi:MAG: flagellar basal-body rod protein FlgG [Armatimonadetes bacterium]|nr:flagellar basal-body rod protein FlgG [Armatimonadota bacterium]
MMRALWTAATGMVAKQLDIDVIAHNLANINTTGYKRGRAEFQDLVSLGLRQSGSPSDSTGVIPVGTQIGLGTRVASIQRVFAQGDFQQTGNPLDLAIEGDGFFQVTQADGTAAYTRNGSFKLDGEGRIVTADGLLLRPPITIPSGASKITVSANGIVSAVLQGQSTPSEVGKIELARFVNPSGLESIGRNILIATPASGEPVVGEPGREGRGTLGQGMLEASNVQLVEEMVRMIAAQRAYEAISKVISTSDEVLQMANLMRR